ncbi:amino acid--tRNA ligase-related protein [Streptomyces lancefieldiae]|uniref:Amino acid--tRNA ligase-related protein n=1 Tax=Streptomyces lancefieldiae TaxID=3075520 RepID=A0ABU3B313_9ACTN|nr:amino acid--tRNA ligase-related protein [Streptomyces sp. DSM 40712]MDT0616500.1 amino acid--tRNA ligase-related protein [Streptomyces sp. DSM 40712]
MTITPDQRRLYGTLLKQHPAERDLLLTKAVLMRAMRAWLHETGYTEVAAPVLCAARESAPIPQFSTSHPLTGDAYHLKHSAEEHLRRLVMSVDRVYDLGKAIRAERADETHAIEFTMLQTAARDICLEDGIGLVTELVQHTVQAAFASLQTPGGIDFSVIPRRPVDDAIAEALGVSRAPEGAELVAAAQAWLKDHGLPAGDSHWAVMEEFVKHAVEAAVTTPVVLHGFPYELRHNSRVDAHGRAQRFSLIAAGVELCDGGVKLRTADDYRPMVKTNIALRTQLHSVPADEGPVDFFADIDYDPADVFTFGLGVERLLALCTGRTVFDTLTFPYH